MNKTEIYIDWAAFLLNAVDYPIDNVQLHLIGNALGTTSIRNSIDYTEALKIAVETFYTAMAGRSKKDKENLLGGYIEAFENGRIKSSDN